MATDTGKRLSRNHQYCPEKRFRPGLSHPQGFSGTDGEAISSSDKRKDTDHEQKPYGTNDFPHTRTRKYPGHQEKNTVQLYDEERKPVMNCVAHRMKPPSPVKGKKPAKKVLPPTGKCRNI